MLEIGFPELLIVLVIVVLVFGPGRLAKMMGEIGSGIRSFREAFTSEEKAGSTAGTDSSTRTSPSNGISTKP